MIPRALASLTVVCPNIIDPVTSQKPLRIIEEIIAKYAVDANLFRLGSTNLRKKNPAPGYFLGFYTEGFLSGGF